MSPVAQTRSNDIIDFLTTLPNRAPSNRFLLHRFNKDAESIAVHNPVEGDTVLGAIACMEHDIPAMHKFHTLALNVSGRSSYALDNYGVSLTKSFFWQDALKIYYEAYQSNPSNLEALRYLINANYKLGIFSKAIEYLNKWDTLTTDKPLRLKDELLKANRFLETAPITENDISRVITVVTEELSETDIIIDAYRFNAIEDGSHTYLNYELEIKDKNTDICEIEFLIDTAITQKIDSMIMDYFCITFCHQSTETVIDSFEMVDESPISTHGKVIDFKKIEELIKDVEPL